jgi:hypothetical protein
VAVFNSITNRAVQCEEITQHYYCFCLAPTFVLLSHKLTYHSTSMLQRQLETCDHSGRTSDMMSVITQQEKMVGIY